ncbi:MAG: hypothetical protein EHM35_21165 [Planctomycetaceae bacterium]|nr:MAG: hypothetical protein EHM35_21165 [Planctomycetaceae bacterium]
MSTSTERAELDGDVKLAIELAAGDNVAAAMYLRSLGQAARMLDDLEDGDAGPVDIGWLAHLLLVALPRNSFFAAHASHLVPLHDVAINAWQDANAMDPDTHFIASEFWASWINEIVCVVAGLVGGYNHRRNVSPRIRTLLYPKWQREAAERQPSIEEAEHNHSLQ